MNDKFAYNETIHAPFIAQVVSITACKLYLELGIAQGYNIHAVAERCVNCIGVDNADNRLFHDFEFHLKTTAEFFKDFNKNPDIIFIDADHTFEQVKSDFVNSLNCLSEHGIIFLHDTDPCRQDLLGKFCCGDSYKIHSWIKENYSELNMITLPITVAGITMVNREKDRRLLKFFKV